MLRIIFVMFQGEVLEFLYLYYVEIVVVVLLYEVIKVDDDID